MDYPYIVKHALALPLLAEAVHEMERESGALNLVAPDWEEKLTNSPVHRAHVEKTVTYSKGHTCNQDKAFIRNIIKSVYKVIVAGYFTYDRSNEKEAGYTSFVVRDCLPLRAIGEAMKENPTQKLHDGARLFMDFCDPGLCHACHDAHVSRNIPLDFARNWCVTKLRIFNGKDIKHAFKKPLEDSLTKMGTFMAICQICIKNRTTFGDDKYKIGGTIQNLIVFQESALKPHTDMMFMDMVNVPTIEFPGEGKAEDDILDI